MKSKSGVYALLALMPLMFASNLVIGRASAGLVEPWTLAFWRWAIATLILLPFAWRAIVAGWDAFRSAMSEISILAALGMLICGGIVYISLHATTATNATLIYTASTFLIVLFDAIYFGNKLTVSRIAGVVIGFLGVAAIVLQGEPTRIATLDLNWGDLGIAICALAWAVYSVMLKGEKLRGLPSLPLFALIAGIGALMLVPPMLYEAVALGAVPSERRAWISILALAIIPSVGAYGIYQYGVKVVGPSITGVFFYLVPVYGVLLAVLTLGETFRAYHAVGLVLVIAGVVLATDPFHRNAARG
jgi:drug/metabolite transporter (DMT)-like permease